MTYTVEAALASDGANIEHLLDLAFGLDRRTKTSYRLREGNQAIEGLSLVVREPGFGLVGAISFWPLAAGADGVPLVLLGPLAVHPGRQNLGIGLKLMQEGLARAKAMGHRLVVLVGDEPYYARVGFKRLPQGRLSLPGPVDPRRFLYLELEEDALAETSGLLSAPWRRTQTAA